MGHRPVARLIWSLATARLDLAPGEFRPGEMRHLTSDITRIRSLGFTPQVDLETGIARYLDWIRAQADVRDYFATAESILRSKGIVRQVQKRIGA